MVAVVCGLKCCFVMCRPLTSARGALCGLQDIGVMHVIYLCRQVIIVHVACASDGSVNCSLLW